ncbi:MAG: hypothetical protein WDN75_07675 [Bacteroidota bacterium]
MRITTTVVTKKLVLFFLIIAGLYLGRSFLIPVAIAALLATLLLPLSQRLEGWKIPKFFSVLFCIVLILLMVSALVWVVSWQVSALITDVRFGKGAIVNHARRRAGVPFQSVRHFP